MALHLQQMVADYSGWHWVNHQPKLPSEPPPSEQLHTINRPTLVVVGERDLPDFQAMAEFMVQRIPHATKVVLSGVGHMSNMEDPERFNEIVLGFLSKKDNNS